MRPLGVLFLALVFALSARAEDWKTEDGKTYKNVTVLNQEDDGVRITYDGGVGKIPYYELPVEIQKRFGQDIESLAIKKKAVDQAMDDAVRNAIAAEQVKQKESTPGYVPPSPAAAVNSAVPGNEANGASPGNQQASSTPAGGEQGAPANNTAPTPSGATANGATANGPTGAPSSANTATPGKGVASNPSTATPGAPKAGPAAAAGAHGGPAHPGVAGTGAREGFPEGLNDYVPGSGGPPVPAPTPYAGSKATYNQALDLSYLDSPPVDLLPAVTAPAKPTKPNASLTLRVISPGNAPTSPDKIEATYLYVGAGNRSDANSAIEFNVDGKIIAIADSARKDSSAMGGAAQALFYLTFYLTPDELKTISSGHDVQISVAPETYKLDGNGVATLQAYQKDLDALPKSASSIMRSYYKLLAKIPSFVSIISTACEYLILGSFAILVCFSIAAFVMGVTRFIKM